MKRKSPQKEGESFMQHLFPQKNQYPTPEKIVKKSSFSSLNTKAILKAASKN